jgi:hypothetical protein
MVIDWEICEQMNDKDMTRAFRACEAQGMKNIMTMKYNWKNEVIGYFKQPCGSRVLMRKKMDMVF